MPRPDKPRADLTAKEAIANLSKEISDFMLSRRMNSMVEMGDFKGLQEWALRAAEKYKERGLSRAHYMEFVNAVKGTPLPGKEGKFTGSYGRKIWDHIQRGDVAALAQMLSNYALSGADLSVLSQSKKPYHRESLSDVDIVASMMTEDPNIFNDLPDRYKELVEAYAEMFPGDESIAIKLIYENAQIFEDEEVGDYAGDYGREEADMSSGDLTSSEARPNLSKEISEFMNSERMAEMVSSGDLDGLKQWALEAAAKYRGKGLSERNYKEFIRRVHQARNIDRLSMMLSNYMLKAAGLGVLESSNAIDAIARCITEDINTFNNMSDEQKRLATLHLEMFPDTQVVMLEDHNDYEDGVEASMSVGVSKPEPEPEAEDHGHDEMVLVIADMKDQPPAVFSGNYGLLESLFKGQGREYHIMKASEVHDFLGGREFVTSHMS